MAHSWRYSRPIVDRVYLDTSAYLAVLLGEKQAAVVSKSTSGFVLCSSTLLLLEAERNLVQLVRQKKLRANDFEVARRSTTAGGTRNRFALLGCCAVNYR